jgi:predicted DNA-binding protein (UPF0251 family)
MAPSDHDKPIWHNEYGLGNAARLDAVRQVVLLGYTQRQVAERMHVHPVTVWKWLRAAGHPTSQRNREG